MDMEMEMEKSGSSGRERNLHLHHHYTRQQLAPTSRFPSRGKGYASRAWPEGSAAINRKSLSLIIWPKRWQAWLTLIFGQNTRPGSKEKQKKNRRDATDHHGKSNELLMLLCIRKGVKNVLSLYLIKSWNSFYEIYLHIYNTY